MSAPGPSVQRQQATPDEHASVEIPLRLIFDARVVINQTTGLSRYVEGLLGAIAELALPLDVRVLVHDGLDRHHALHALADHDAAPARFRIERVPVRGVHPLQHLRMRGVLRQWSCDLYHYPHYDLPAFVPHRAVITVHDLKFLRYPQLLSGRARALYVRGALRLAVARAARFLVVSASTGNDLAQLLGVSPDRIDIAHIAPADMQPPDPCLLEPLGLEPGFFLFVGEGRKHKNVTQLIRAYERVRAERREVPPLVVAGHRYRDYDEPERLVESLGLGHCVRFVDGASDATLATLYHAACAFLLPSLYEGFGIPILEAMRAGVPVVTSNVSSMPEVAGDAALLVEPHNPASIARAMMLLLDDPRLAADLVMRGRRNVERFSWQQTARATFASYACAAGVTLR